jgi:biopolymer transport protein ExbB
MAKKLCNNSILKNPLAFLLKIVFDNVEFSKEKLQNLAEIEIRKQMIPFEHFLTALNIISLISPLLGLLGTVIGMIKSFVFISQGNIEQSLVASGISEALITTAMGLTIAIPTMVCYNFFVRKIDKLFNNVELGVSEIINHLK